MTTSIGFHCVRPEALEVVEGQGLIRSVRLARIQFLLFTGRQGFTTRELAELCGVSQRTIQRDILSLHDMGVPVTQDGDRYSILHGYLLPPVTFSLNEAVALFLASRLIFRQTDESNPHIQSALQKIADVLPSGVAQKLRQSIDVLAQKAPNLDYVSIFEKVATAWATQRRLRICYRSLRGANIKQWLVDPYFIEMTGVGYSTYVIGYARSEDREGLTTFKLDRIAEAELLNENFQLPADLHLEKLLSSSWGVIWGDAVTEIKLRFFPQVVRRVKESLWHPSQQIEDLPDGSCVLSLRVPSTMEITPWIRSWGPDVEVLAPQELREQFCRWSEQSYRLYHSPSSLNEDSNGR